MRHFQSYRKNMVSFLSCNKTGLQPVSRPVEQIQDKDIHCKRPLKIVVRNVSNQKRWGNSPEHPNFTDYQCFISKMEH